MQNRLDNSISCAEKSSELWGFGGAIAECGLRNAARREKIFSPQRHRDTEEIKNRKSKILTKFFSVSLCLRGELDLGPHSLRQDSADDICASSL
jgi:hypothetical protein